jgi:DNA-binding response OmpR family regulator
MTPRVLVVDDESDMATIVAYGVRMLWPDAEVETAADGVEALRRFNEHQPDLVILDVSMPPPDGFAVLERIRVVSQVPVMMLTAHGATADKVRAFDLGADDYLTKPFDHLELLARLRALLRRMQPAQAGDALPPPFSIGSLTLDPTTRQVRVGERTAALTATEYRLLEELARHAGRVLPYDYLLTHVWGPEYRSDLPSLRVFIQRVRDKLQDEDGALQYIQTERGVGYRFVLPG